MGQDRYVMWIPGASPEWGLTGVVDSYWCSGGHRTMHELAVAIAATGRPIEMRGHVDLELLRPLAEAAGAWPELPSDPRPIRPDDSVIVPAGSPSPLTFANVALSPARAILLMMSPPGLCGWSFMAGWSQPSPLEVAVDDVAQPEHFRAMAAMGFELWTNSPQLCERIDAAGVPGRFLGRGAPTPFPDPLPKRYDVVTLAQNRWADLARAVVNRMGASVVHHEIPAADNHEVLRQLGQARLFIHPMRIEGDSRLALEARAMGAVPLVLGGNPFNATLDEDAGAVAAGSIEEMACAAMGLLRQPERLAALRERGIASARAQVDWDSYLRRLEDVLASPPPPDPAREARSVIGAHLREREEALALQLRQAEAAVASGRLRLDSERALLREEIAEAREAIQRMRDTRAWRLASRYWRTRATLARAIGRTDSR